MKFSAFLLFLIPAVAQQPAVGPDTVVLTVFDRQYTRAEFEEIARLQNLDIREAATRLQSANTIGRSRALAEEARRRGLDRSEAVRLKIENYENAVLTQALFDALVAEIHKDESLARKRLESNQHFAEERQLRQILIRHTKSIPTPGKLTPEQALAKAEALRKKIAAGASFAEVARTESDDERTKSKGGDMGFLRKPLLIPEFGEAAFQLKVGEVSAPVKTTEGYHLILVEKVAPPSFEAVRKSLEWEIARERMQELPVTGIKMNPDYFGK